MSALVIIFRFTIKHDACHFAFIKIGYKNRYKDEGRKKGRPSAAAICQYIKVFVTSLPPRSFNPLGTVGFF